MRFLGILIILLGFPMLMVIPPVGLVMFVLGLLMLISGFGSSNARKTARALAQEIGARHQPAAAPDNTWEDERDERWAALAKYDDDIRGAVDRLRPLGPVAINRLRNAYMALNDKTKLPAIVRDIEEGFNK